MSCARWVCSLSKVSLPFGQVQTCVEIQQDLPKSGRRTKLTQGNLTGGCWQCWWPMLAMFDRWHPSSIMRALGILSYLSMVRFMFGGTFWILLEPSWCPPREKMVRSRTHLPKADLLTFLIQQLNRSVGPQLLNMDLLTNVSLIWSRFSS